MEIAFGLALIIFGVFPLLAIGAVILRVACRFCSVPPPTFSWAILIVLVAVVLTFPASLGIELGLWAAFEPRSYETAAFTTLGLALSVLTGMAISAGVYQRMLPGVTFGKGVALYWVEVLISLVLAAIVVIPLFMLLAVAR